MTKPNTNTFHTDYWLNEYDDSGVYTDDSPNVSETFYGYWVKPAYERQRSLYEARRARRSSSHEHWVCVSLC